MAKMRYRKPSPKTVLGWTKFKKRIKKALGVNAVLRPFRAVPNYKRRLLRNAGYYSPEMKMLRAAQRKQVPGPIGAIQIGDREQGSGRQQSNQTGLGALLLASAMGKGQPSSAKGRKKPGAGGSLLGALLLGTALTREHQKAAPKEGRAHPRKRANGNHHEPEHDERNPPPESEPHLKPPAPRGRGALIALVVVVLGVLGLLWLNAHLPPASMFHAHLNVGGQGTHFVQFLFQQGKHTLIQISFDAIQLLLVLTIAAVETLLVGLTLGRARPLRLLEGLIWSLVGIWVFTHVVPLVWKGDYALDGIPFFTTVIGAFASLVLFHLLRGGVSRPAAPAMPPVSEPPLQNGAGGAPIAATPVAAPPLAAAPVAALPIAPATAAIPGVQLLFHSQRAAIDPSLVEQLVSFILATEHSLDGAIYDLRHPQVLQALATVAHSKRLRLAVDAGKGRLGADPKPGGNEEALQQADLSSHATMIHEGNHLMHNKFLIRDGRTIWTGSANFTSGGLGLQDNNCLIIDSPELAQQYEATFLDLLSPTHEHQPARGRSLMGQPVQLSGAVITPGFAPAAGEGIEDMIMALLRGARKVRIMAFLIGDAGILEALDQVRNADVKGIYDPSGMEDVLRSSRQDRSHFWFLHDSRFVAAPSHAFHANGEQDFMHNKVFIINDEWVVTGSYNFSENAEANDENVLQIHSPAIAAAYTNYFDSLYTLYRQHPGEFKEPARRPAARRGARGGRGGRARSQQEGGLAGILKLFQGR